MQPRNIFSSIVFILLITAFSSAQTNRERGIELYSKGRFKEAIKVFKKAVSEQDTKGDVQVWNYLGLAYIGEGDVNSGIDAFKRAEVLGPDNSGIKANLAWAFYRLNLLDEASQMVEKALALDSSNLRVYYIRGKISLIKKEYDQSIAEADTMISKYRNYPQAYSLKADALVAKYGRKYSGEGTEPLDIGLLSQAAEILEDCINSCLYNDLLSEQIDRRKTILVFYEFFVAKKNAKSTQAVNSPAPTEKRLTDNILRQKTDSVSSSKSRVVTLMAILGGDGKVHEVLVIDGSDDRRNELAIKAAGKIKFVPKKVGGKPVTSLVTVQYTFNYY